jgi:hypothetical protein
MCFSATASFGAAIVLSGIGIATIKKAQKPSQIVFASIPLVFAAQQFAEGVLWVTLPNTSDLALQKVMTAAFLFFAQVVWPLCVPVAIYMLEKDHKHQIILKILVGTGVVISAFLGYCLVVYPVQAEIIGQHIAYQQDYPVSLKTYGAALYLLATIAPLFLSTIKRMWLLGACILISYAVTAVFYEHYILSVWCFFSSIISITVYAIMVELPSLKKRSVARIASYSH